MTCMRRQIMPGLKLLLRSGVKNPWPSSTPACLPSSTGSAVFHHSQKIETDRSMSSPTISVIVPVYNAAKYLDACIESLLGQSFADCEFLLINDGSKDNSLEICQRYAERDARIRVFDKPNGGVSSARNAGLDDARGAWIIFVDSDDRVTSDYLNGLYTARKQVPADSAALVISGFKAVDADTLTTITTKAYPAHIYDRENIARGFIDNQIVRSGYIASKVYDRQLIERLNLRFDPLLSFGEDLVFMLSYLRHAQYLITAPGSDYLYSRNTNGLSVSYSDFDKEYLSLCAMTSNVEAILGKDCMDPVWPGYHTMRSLRVLSCLYRPKTKRSRKERLTAIKRIATEQQELFRLSKNFRILLLSRHRYALFDTLTSGLYHLRFSFLKHFWGAWIKFKNSA